MDPALRRQGLGRALAIELVTVARTLGLATVFLRVEPDNVAGIAYYTSSGIVPMSDEEAAEFSAGQPATYHWMRIP